MSTSCKSSFSGAFREPLTVAQMMNNFPHSWCICGGWAIDLFVKRISRLHKDVDIAIWRNNQLVLRDYLMARGWTLEKAVDGQLFPWIDSEFLELPVHTVWCRNPNIQPDFIEILLNEHDQQHFRFRREFSITYPIEDAIVNLESGLPILAPEIVLLYKAKNASKKNNQHDFEVALPHLNCDRRTWLKSALARVHPEHEWLAQL
jgi:hypothetical protein